MRNLKIKVVFILIVLIASAFGSITEKIGFEGQDHGQFQSKMQVEITE